MDRLDKVIGYLKGNTTSERTDGDQLIQLACNCIKYADFYTGRSSKNWTARELFDGVLTENQIKDAFEAFFHDMGLTYDDAAISQLKSIEEVNEFYEALNKVTKGNWHLEPRDKKYLLIVTEEDKRYENGEVGLTYFADHPEEGKFKCIVECDNVNELFEVNDIEGLFYQLYDAKNFERISYGSIDYDRIEEEIVEYESR